MPLKVEAITFDDFNTLRYGVEEQENIVYPIYRALKKGGFVLEEDEFVKEFFRIHGECERRVKETLRETLLDDIIVSTLRKFGYNIGSEDETVKKAVDEGLASRRTNWYPDAIETLSVLRKRGYKLGLISNTHWRFLEDVRKTFKIYFHVITLSYEHGYVKPHPSIFLITLKMLGVEACRCLHVGDNPIADVQGARNVGMKTAFIKREGKKTHADIQIKQLNDLLSFL